LIAKTKRNLNARTGPKGSSLLHAAAWSNAPASLTVLSQLVRAGVNVELKRRSDGHTALIVACDGKFDLKVEVLLQGGASVHTRRQDVGGTALHYAAMSNSEKCIEILIDAGADIESKISVGMTPLYAAATHSSWKSISFLIEKGARIEPRVRRAYTDTSS